MNLSIQKRLQVVYKNLRKVYSKSDALKLIKGMLDAKCTIQQIESELTI